LIALQATIIIRKL